MNEPLSVIEQIEQLEDQRYRAMLDHDLEALDRLLCEDLLYVHSNALVDSKASYLQFLRSGTGRYTRIEREEVLVRPYGDAAVVTGRILIAAIIAGEERFIDNRFVNIWARRECGWQLVHWASTPIPR